MKRQSLVRWLAACLLGPALAAAGCKHEPQPCKPVPCPHAVPSATPGPPAGATPEQTQAPPLDPERAAVKAFYTPGPGPKVTCVIADDPVEETPTLIAAQPVEKPAPVEPAPQVVAQSLPFNPPAAPRPEELPAVRPTISLEPASLPEPVAPPRPPEPTLPPVGMRLEAEPDASPAATKKPAGPREPGPARKSFVDLTAQECFGHAPDHAWLSGEVHYSRAANAWRLRYASVDENDPYDGTVTLVGHEQLATLHDGQHVRVEGSLLDAQRKESGSPYRVTVLEPVELP